MHWPWSNPPAPLDLPSINEQFAFLRERNEMIVERLDHVEDHYKRLERRFGKLQGEFSAYMRDRFEADDYEDEEDEDYGQDVRRA